MSGIDPLDPARSARWKAWLWALANPGMRSVASGMGVSSIFMPEVSRERFVSWFGELATIGRTETGWNRLAWSPLEAEARAWFSRTATTIGLDVRQDGAGTLWAVTDDADRGPWVCAGSHLDTQPDGGAYDGALGVVSALEAAASVLESEAGRRHPLAVVAFVDEEGARFRTPTFASLAITGGLDIDHVLEVMGDAPAIYGVTRDSLAGSREQLERVRCFLEVHVEQGRSLADRDLALGIADVLAPRQRWRVEFEGESNHAGTTRMEAGATLCCRPPGSCWRWTRPPAPAPAPSAPSAGSRCTPGRRTRSPAWSP